MNLFVFGLGYSVQHFLRTHADTHAAAGTVRLREKAAKLRETLPGVDAVLFDDADAVRAKLAQADAILVSIAPGEGDPALALYAEAIAASPATRIVYLSTIGVYGDHDGAWIDESAPLRPVSRRNAARVVAEEQWHALATPRRRVNVLRLAGIYGPSRNQIENLRDGTARRTIKPGQVFNRIHVEDISRAIAACLAPGAPDGIVNVTDDEPAPPQDVVVFAAALLGIEPPPPVPFEAARMSPMALSFWDQNKRVANQRLRETFGVVLACPTYREGLRACL